MSIDISRLRREIERRRSSAICSHLDAGETTPTETFLETTQP